MTNTPTSPADQLRARCSLPHCRHTPEAGDQLCPRCADLWGTLVDQHRQRHAPALTSATTAEQRVDAQLDALRLAEALCDADADAFGAVLKTSSASAIDLLAGSAFLLGSILRGTGEPDAIGQVRAQVVAHAGGEQGGEQ